MCSAEVSCNDVCVASAQVSIDTVTLTAEVETVAPTRKSDLVFVHLINPETYEKEDFSDLVDPVEVKLTLEEPLDIETYDYKVTFRHTL